MNADVIGYISCLFALFKFLYACFRMLIASRKPAERFPIVLSQDTRTVLSIEAFTCFTVGVCIFTIKRSFQRQLQQVIVKKYVKSVNLLVKVLGCMNIQRVR